MKKSGPQKRYTAARDWYSVPERNSVPKKMGRASLQTGRYRELGVLRMLHMSDRLRGAEIAYDCVKPWSQNIRRPSGRLLMVKNCRKVKSLSGSRPGPELFQLWSHNRRLLCSNPLFSIAAKHHCVLLWPLDWAVSAQFRTISQSPQGGCATT